MVRHQAWRVDTPGLKALLTQPNVSSRGAVEPSLRTRCHIPEVALRESSHQRHVNDCVSGHTSNNKLEGAERVRQLLAWTLSRW